MRLASFLTSFVRLVLYVYRWRPRHWVGRVVYWVGCGLLCSSVGLWLALRITFGILPKPPLVEDMSFSRALYDREGKLLRLTLAQDERYRLYMPLAGFPAWMAQATLLQEDQYFYYHPGINPLSLFKALWHTYVSRDFTMGASTISMQVARLRFHLHTRTVKGKLQQLFRAVQLEHFYSKEDLLTAYLNMAPYGQNVEGVGAASLVYLHKRPSELSLADALLLAVIPQSPLRRDVSTAREDQKTLLQARQKLFERWVRKYPKEEAQRVAMATLPALYEREALPFRAPHFVHSVLEDNPRGQGEQWTTLDGELQAQWERKLAEYVDHRSNKGIRNAAALLVHVPSMDVRVAIGSAHFQDVAIEGQVNGLRAKRSPGSALKPFVYALALQQGLIHSLTLLKDTPKSFGAYNPENFDGKFTGPLSATEALNQSRNIPAVTLASQLQNPTLYEFLQKARIRGMRESTFYGLSPVLGGLEVTMEELAQLYATLAQLGWHRPLRTLRETSYAQGEQILSAEAAYVVQQMMYQNPHPSSGAALPLPVAWKTGTSFAYRDAWSAGILGPYVVVVWVGNFDGQGNPAFTGRFAAAPLMFRLLEGLPAASLQPTVAPSMVDSLHVTRVDVCANSGYLASRVCPRTTKGWFLPGVSPIQMDDINREVALDAKTGLRTCHPEPGRVRFEVYEFWPSDLQLLFRQAGVPRRPPPAFGPDCSLDAQAEQGRRPEITSPHNQVKYVMRLGATTPERVALSAVADADVKKLHWFVGAEWVGTTTPQTPLFWPLRPGTFTVRVVDEHGRSDAMSMEVITIAD